MFSCEYCEVFQNNSFYRTPLVATPVLALDKKQQKVFPNVPVAEFRNGINLKDNLLGISGHML